VGMTKKQRERPGLPRTTKPQGTLAQASLRSGEDLRRTLSAKYPVLRGPLSRCGTPYTVASALARFINEAIETSRRDTADAALTLAESFFLTADPELKNAFYCDFCEVLDLRSERGRELFGRLHPELQRLYRKAQEYIGQPYPGSPRVADQGRELEHVRVLLGRRT
jgi:hypothetical protein